VLLGSVGLGSAWLVALAWLAAPHRTALLVAAAILLAGGAGAFIWRRRTAACRADAAPAGPGAVAALAAIVLLGGALAVLGYLYA
jgi:mercuric ion transport protein